MEEPQLAAILSPIVAVAALFKMFFTSRKTNAIVWGLVLGGLSIWDSYNYDVSTPIAARNFVFITLLGITALYVAIGLNDRWAKWFERRQRPNK